MAVLRNSAVALSSAAAATGKAALLAPHPISKAPKLGYATALNIKCRGAPPPQCVAAAWISAPIQGSASLPINPVTDFE